MSTYLVAFLVGDFNCTTGKSDGVPIRVCSTPDKVKLTQFALESAEFTSSTITTPTSASSTPCPSSISSASLTSRPAPWRTSAAITYRETDLLVDEERQHQR